eukprot:tig00000881_g5226.t1
MASNAQQSQIAAASCRSAAGLRKAPSRAAPGPSAFFGSAGPLQAWTLVSTRLHRDVSWPRSQPRRFRVSASAKDESRGSDADVLGGSTEVDCGKLPNLQELEAGASSLHVESPDRGPHHARGLVLLNLVIFLWASNFSVIKDGVESLAPSIFNLCRFSVASVAFLPFALRERDPALWKTGMELALWLALGYATQAIALKFTSATSSAFISTLQVILVPLIAGLFGRRISPAIWTSALLAFGGVGLIAYDGAAASAGDLLNLLFALFCSCYVIRLEANAGKFPAQALSGVQLFGLVIFSAIWVAVERPPLDPSTIPWLAIVYLGVVTTALTTWLETIALRDGVTASEAALTYSLEPRAAVGARGWAGAALVLAGSAYSQLTGAQRLVERFAASVIEKLTAPLRDERGALPAWVPVPASMRRARASDPPTVRFDNGADESRTLLIVEAPDRAGLLGDVVRAIARSGLDISSAQAPTVAGRVEDRFLIASKAGRKIPASEQPELAAELLAELERRASKLTAGARRTVSPPSSPGAETPSVYDSSPSQGDSYYDQPEPALRLVYDGMSCEMDNGACSVHTVLTFSCPDRPGLLSDIATSIAQAGCVIHRADIATLRGRAADVVHVTDEAGRKLDSERMQEIVEGILAPKGNFLPRFQAALAERYFDLREQRSEERGAED